MDRPTTREDGAAPEMLDGPRGAPLLPSRRPALEACRATLDSGPILLTGDAGSGKTWLCNRLAASDPARRRWVGVDVTPAIGPEDFHRLLARELGLVPPDRGGPARSEVADFLADRLADGDRRALVIEEAHNLSLAVWEEVRVLTNRLGRPGGFASLLIVGQTPLARRFATSAYAPLDARLAARVHLGPIDADEAGELLASARPGRPWSRSEVEAFHVESGGNPGRMLRRLGPAPRTPAIPSPVAPAPAAIAQSPAPLIGPSRPPLRSEENLIEVGWSPEEAIEPGTDEEHPASVGEGRPASPPGDEAVHDHYAALQAWREWAENQGRLDAPAASDRDLADAIDDGLAAEATEELSPPVERPTIWADEAEDAFAPFSQLFSRMAQTRPRAPE